MSKASGGNSNSAAKERQLKKIYDCLNIGCNKKAVQEVDRLPKKIRDLTVFKALKALALTRMCKRNQALELLNEINVDDDLDEATLQTMTSCYKESVDIVKIVALYEAAARRRPNDVEIMAHLFMAYVRVFNFKRQKEVALQMYKNFSKKKRLYSFWAIMSLVLEAQEADTLGSENGPDKRVCLSLAEKMCEKMMDDERTHEEIELYLMILKKQNKYEEEYKFLTGPICLRITDHLSWFNRRRAYLCFDLKMYSRAFKHYFPTLIQEYPDQIEYYQGLFRSAFLLDTEAPSQQQPVAISDQQPQGSNQQTGTPVKSSSALAECYDVVEKQCLLALETNDLAKDQTKGKVQATSKSLSRTSSLNPNRQRLLRGPFIARIELYHTIQSNGNILPNNISNLCMNQFSSRFPKLNSLLMDYFQSFGKKIICFFDMDYMINRFKISDQDRFDLVISIKNWVDELKRTQNDLETTDSFYYLLNYHMLQHAIHHYKIDDTQDERLKMAKKFVDLYDENRHIGKNTNKTEFLPVDHYCLLAINSIMTNSISVMKLDSQSILTDKTILSLIVMLESAIQNSPSNHQLKFILLKLYSFIGASKQCSEVLSTLDIKHFQIDTLGHLLNPVLYNTGNYSLSQASLEACLEFYSHGVRECYEGLTTSYRDGKFSKIEEITNVLRRLGDSINATQCVLLRGVVSSLYAGSHEEIVAASESFDPSKGLNRLFRRQNLNTTIKDNRDFKVLKSLHFETNELIQKRREETLADEQLWLKMRYFLIRASFIQSECSLTQNDNLLRQSIKDYLYGFQEVERICEEIKVRVSEQTSDDRYSFLEPESSPFRWKHINFEALTKMARALVFSISLCLPAELDYPLQLEAVVNDLETQLANINSLATMKQALLSLTISLEFISLCSTSLISIPQFNEICISKTAQPNDEFEMLPHQAKLKATISGFINKTEIQLTKLSNTIKAIDPKALILDKVVDLEEILYSDPMHSAIEVKGSSPLQPIMSRAQSQQMLSKIKEKILDSYKESLKEIENLCRRKARLLRSKT